MKRIVIVVLLAMFVLLVGCVDVDVYTDVQPDGNVDVQMEISGEGYILSLIESSILDDSEGLTLSRESGKLIVEGKLEDEKYAFKETGNWFRHKFSYTQISLFDEDMDTGYVTAKQYVNMPGKITYFSGCKTNPVDNGYDLICTEQVIKLESQCYLWFC